MRRSLLSALGLLAAALAAQSAEAASVCAAPPGTAGDIIYNSTYNRVQYCNGADWVNVGSSGSEVGIGTLTAGDFCTSDGSLINCTTGAISLTSQVTGTLQAAQFPALTGDVTTTAGSLVTQIGSGKVTNAMLAATGTANNTTFLRGDGTWASVPGGSTSAGLTIAGGTSSESWTTVSVSTVSNTLLGSNPSTSQFSAPSTGNYLITGQVTVCTNPWSGVGQVGVQVNGSMIGAADTGTNCNSGSFSVFYHLNAGDTVAGVCTQNSGISADCEWSFVRF